MLYKGIIVDNQDPDGYFRVLVNVLGINRDATDSVIWAEVIGSTEFGLENEIGISSVLRVGTWVWIMFEDEDSKTFQKPVVIGVLRGDGDKHPTLKSEYTTSQVIKTQCGHTITISDTDGKQRIHIYHTKGTEILIDNDGNIIIHGVKDFNSTIDGNYNLTVKGNITVNCDGAINSTSSSTTNIKGSTINLN